MLSHYPLNIYCDESCHLRNDGSRVMGLGAIACVAERKDMIVDRIHRIKDYYGYSFREIKWSNVTLNQVEMCKALIDLFWNSASLAFRGLIIPHKDAVASSSPQSFDEFYYKMYYQLLVVLLDGPSIGNLVFLDRKDSQGKKKINKLFHILGNATQSEGAIDGIVEIDSQCSDLLQLSDLILGMIVHHKRGLTNRGNSAKRILIDYLRSKVDIECSTMPGEKKFNLFFWEGLRNV